MAVVLVPFLFLTDTWAFPVLLALLSARSVFEMFRCLGIHKLWFVSVPAYILAAASPITARLLGAEQFSQFAIPVCVAFSFWVFCVFTFSNDSITLEQTGEGTAMTLYITGGFTFLVLTCDLAKYGYYLMLTVFIASWITDTFAYFVGMLFGKHKLIPKISPKKTVEGAVGGIFFCMAAFVLYGFLISRITDISPKYVMLAVAGLLASVVSQAGDLLMSAVKRSRSVKDYGRLLPGHGGILDRFDSVLAVSVIIYTFENFFNMFE